MGASWETMGVMETKVRLMDNHLRGLKDVMKKHESHMTSVGRRCGAPERDTSRKVRAKQPTKKRKLEIMKFPENVVL